MQVVNNNVITTNAEATDNDDGTISFELTDDNGNVLDTYVIDPETGVVTGSLIEIK